MTGKQSIGSLTIPWSPTVGPENEESCYPYRRQVPGTTTIPPGWTFAKGRRPVEEPSIHEERVSVPLRDGVKIQCDVFRPETDKKLPALLAVSPYGKNGHGFRIFDNIPFRLGLPESSTSGLEKFEGQD
ncbi:hypothetical protein AUEXF2481DRAFT_31465 [Aureobasidium subglaciale EXF-2481]|uniref:Xaa-Pro dipeptidyl-peptidase-like domain-containing protein n=1 Tax=Aureobasidium subglaciale (strain EXF-2481) TaxID=1043005 RepID=A0A074Z1N9_AURSE|nr:uncharacterized protein AUEXF2481DRAFT_31465 [Aureobasidium subglaciale EXF-2481]KEQ92996.1 hypothetical protein AUEXF2481DRAFT_31465 [Aureobasidium subglaciale EXF-2481]